MANICPVCGEKIRFLSDGNFPLEGIEVHTRCMGEFNKNPDKYGGKAREPDNESIERPQKKVKENQQKIEDKSVYVKGFNMPFEEIVIFMVKCALASIPAFIILAIIGGIFFLIFAAIFS